MLTRKNASVGPAPDPADSAPFIQSGDRRRAVADILTRAQQAAGGLYGLGVREDDVVAILLRNDFAFFEASSAAGWLGAYATPINWHATPEEVAYILRDSAAKVLVAHADLLAPIRETLSADLLVFCVETPAEVAAAYGVAVDGPPPPRSIDWATFVETSPPHEAAPVGTRGAMIYTSGTTGQPKGVRRRPMGPEAQDVMRTMAAGYGLSPDLPMRVLMNGPMYHSAPNTYAMAALQLGASFVLQPRFEAEELLAMIAAHRITHMHIVPTMLHRLLSLPEAVRRRYDVSSLVDVVHGAAPCPPAVKRAMIEWWGPVVSEYYGSTETGLVARLTSQEAMAHPGSVGRALPGCEIIIVGPSGERLARGETGDIYVRSPLAATFTYHGAPEKRAEIERDGYVTAGDIGYLDDGGFVYLSDRRKDMIISGGVNIYPAEIEAAILALPGVRDCAVFGGPDPEFGERVVAHIELEPGQAPNREWVRSQLTGRLASFKIPKLIEFSDALPREDSGKIFKRKLREPYWADTGRNI